MPTTLSSASLSVSFECVGLLTCLVKLQVCTVFREVAPCFFRTVSRHVRLAGATLLNSVGDGRAKEEVECC